MTTRCKGKKGRDWRYYPCMRTATRDGYCGTHHPDAVAKREAKREATSKENARKLSARIDAQNDMQRRAKLFDEAMKHLRALQESGALLVPLVRRHDYTP